MHRQREMAKELCAATPVLFPNRFDDVVGVAAVRALEIPKLGDHDWRVEGAPHVIDTARFGNEVGAVSCHAVFYPSRGKNARPGGRRALATLESTDVKAHSLAVSRDVKPPASLLERHGFVLAAGDDAGVPGRVRLHQGVLRDRLHRRSQEDGRSDAHPAW